MKRTRIACVVWQGRRHHITGCLVNATHHFAFIQLRRDSETTVVIYEILIVLYREDNLISL